MSSRFTEAQYPAALPRIRVTEEIREAIIQIAREEKRSIGDIQREALQIFLQQYTTKRRINPSDRKEQTA